MIPTTTLFRINDFLILPMRKLQLGYVMKTGAGQRSCGKDQGERDTNIPELPDVSASLTIILLCYVATTVL